MAVIQHGIRNRWGWLSSDADVSVGDVLARFPSIVDGHYLAISLAPGTREHSASKWIQPEFYLAESNDWIAVVHTDHRLLERVGEWLELAPSRFEKRTAD